MILVIDDQNNYEYADVIIRSFEAARLFIYETTISKKFDELLLDHDLGSKYEYETGYDLLKIGLHLDVIPKKVWLITKNPVGRKRMKDILIDYNYIQSEMDPTYFTKGL